MTRNSRRFLCLALAVFLFTALLPADLTGSVARAEDTLGIVTKENVNFRVGPSMSDKLLFRIPINTVLVVKNMVTANNYDWYQVMARDPEKTNSLVYTGYIRGDCFRLLTEEESAAYTGIVATAEEDVTTTVVVTAAPASGAEATAIVSTDSDAPEGTKGWITAGGVNFRVLPGREVIQQLDRGTEVTVLTIPSVISTSTWYKVEYDGKEGYIMSTFLNLNGTGPVVTAEPTAAPTNSGSDTETEALGYVMTIKGSVNIRASIGGTSLTTVGIYETFPYLLAPVKRGSYTWYFVQVSATMKGYIRGDCVKIVKAPANNGGNNNGNNGGTVTAAPVITATPTPAPDTPSGYVKTTIDYVNIRKGVWGDRISIAKKKGTVYAYYGEPKVSGNTKWYYIYGDDFGFGYIHGGYVTVTDETGAATPTPVPEATPTPEATAAPEPGAPTAAPTNSGNITPGGNVSEASYTTLKNGSSGQAVTNLVTELKNQGYYKYEITSKYTSAVENAVRAFQKAKGLAVDGIAGNDTQHALFNTVPIGTADRENRSITLYPAEKIDWNTGGIQDLWPRGANVKVYDVKTGKVWWAHRWAGGSHIDAEPLTAADTKILCEIYGVNSASEITEKTHWQRRPCLVTIGTRTFACSLYGVPHNPDGDTIKDNNFTGQLCIHFTNSKTHGSNKVDSLHAEAIEYAWLNAPNGHK